MNIFERASRAKLRFETGRIGLISTEQLWDLPLTAKGDGADLDKLARAASRELRELEEDSFVKKETDPRKAELALKLEVLKHVIDAKLAAAAASEKAVATSERKRKLLAALASKEDQALAGMTREQIVAEIEALSA